MGDKGTGAIVYGDPITGWDYLPNGVGKDVFHVGSDGHLYLKQGKKMVLIPHNGVIKQNPGSTATVEWTTPAPKNVLEKQLRDSLTDSAAKHTLEGAPDIYVNFPDSDNDGLCDIDTNGLYDNDFILTGFKEEPIKDKMRSYRISGGNSMIRYSTFAFHHLKDGATLVYKIGAQYGYAGILQADNTFQRLNPTVAEINGRMVMSVPVHVTLSQNPSGDEQADVVEISWNPKPKTRADLNVQVQSWRDASTPDGTVLNGLTAGSDVDGDGKPDTVTKETTFHPYKVKTAEFPTGLNTSVTVPEHTRLGISHSDIGQQIE